MSSLRDRSGGADLISPWPALLAVKALGFSADSFQLSVANLTCTEPTTLCFSMMLTHFITVNVAFLSLVTRVPAVQAPRLASGQLLISRCRVQCVSRIDYMFQAECCFNISMEDTLDVSFFSSLPCWSNRNRKEIMNVTRSYHQSSDTRAEYCQRELRQLTLQITIIHNATITA